MNALFTVNINNDPSRNSFMSQNTRDSFKDACYRWGCDYVELTESTIYHPSSMKMKALELTNYDRLFIIDSDAIIRSDTPSPFDIFNPDLFYASKNQQSHFPPPYDTVNITLAYEEMSRLNPQTILNTVNKHEIAKNFFNAGVELVNRKHSEILEYGFELFNTANGLQWWDQIAINVAVYSRLGGYTDLGPSWNYQFPSDLNHMTQYIYHFAGNPSRYSILETVNWKI